MEIVNEVRRKVKFKDLPIGETFYKEDSHYLFMKTLPLMLGEMENVHPINAIVLNDGSVSKLDDDAEVIVVECKITMLREGW